MAKLSWDNPEDRTYSTGIDRGVIYYPEADVRQWNGLLSVTHNQSAVATPSYFEGVRSSLNIVDSGFSAVVSSLTFPNELILSAGYSDIGKGVMAYTNTHTPFHMTYRTMNSDAVSEDDYTIHIIYNAYAIMPEAEYETINVDPNPTSFEWEIESVPVSYSGGLVSYIFINTRQVDRTKVKDLEDALYGTDGPSNPYMPSADVVVSLL